MAKIISTIKAILTRLIFGAHSLLAVWQVTQNENDIFYWVLSGPLLLLLLEGIFTLMIKKTQEWRWFCPSVFLYLASIVPAIWLLELDKVKRRLSGKEELAANNSHLPPGLDDLLDETGIKVPRFNKDTWTTLIEEFLMLILIVGRWMLPKGDLTRDQLSQLLLVYIGIAADIIEFIDSYKDNSIAEIPFLVYLTLGIWSWSLLQFTIVLSATKARRPRGSGAHTESADCCSASNCCCGIEVWGIVLNVILQDAPFLTVRLLIIFQYNIINYMNIFFTCKNSLVIILQIYRLYVVNAEFCKNRREQKAAANAKIFHNHKARRLADQDDANSIYMIATDRTNEHKRKFKKERGHVTDETILKKRDKKNKKHKRKDTGYSTASSQNLYSTKIVHEKPIRRKEKKAKKIAKNSRHVASDIEAMEMKKAKRHKNKDKKLDKKKSRKVDAVIEESKSSVSSDGSNSTLPSYEVINEKRVKSKHHKRSSSDSSSNSSSTDSSSSSSSGSGSS